jgi:TPR repeat protein
LRIVDSDPYSQDALAQGMAHLGAPEPDHEQAVHWFRVAADAGDNEGLSMLAFCQLEGLGLPRDAELAREHLELASAQGSLTAQFNLGRALVAGWGGAADAARGVALYTAAAAQGHADATFNLATCLDAGWGYQPDHLAAKALFLRARALGCTLRTPDLRVRERELDGVRKLANRFAHRSDLARLIGERQHEIALIQELVRHPSRKSRLSRRQRDWLARAVAMTASLTGAMGALFGWRGGRRVAHDAGPTSIG